ncbi:transcriptional regulator [Rhodococcus jostii]|uniref:Uncharacterized protein n=1 Tax=Rhodococcus jostii TaxID=132919 RepID=A0A1H5HUG9_RHOJO|nr:transcriptional regulator [Rhodococcus jostii]SEE31450.1 hypothetical protein SAMN04490220_7347 [Rhodococcus jostii]
MQDPKKDESTPKPAADTPSDAGAANSTEKPATGGDAAAKSAASEPAAPTAKSPEPKPPQKKVPEKADRQKPEEPQAPLPKPPAPRPKAAKPEEKASEAATTAIPMQKGAPASPDAETVAIPLTKPAVPATPPPPRPAASANQSRPNPAQQRQNSRPVPPPPAPPRPAPAPPKAAPQRVLPPQQSAPQRVAAAQQPPKKHGKAWLFAAIAAGVIVVAAIAVTGVIVYNNNQAENSPEAQVQGTIDTFVAALTQGDLATLRTSTCGSLAEYYQGISDQDFAEVHQVAVTQQNIPVVGGVDAVQITGDTAIAQVKAHTAANPSEQSWRTFNLEKVDGTWKICDPR